MECVSGTSLNHCSCTYRGCDKHGNCCKCVTFHRSRGEIPGCLFPPEGERTYDRSLANFIRCRQP